MQLYSRLSSIVGGKNRQEVLERILDHLLPMRKEKLHPISLDYLCNNLGITVSTVSSSTVRYRGKFDWTKADTPRITLRADRNHRRKNFTLAHEIGHWMTQVLLPDLKHESYRLSADRSPDSEEERLADELALELLLPRRVFDAHAHEPCTLRSLDKLCDLFQVQRTIALQRLSVLADKELLYAIIVPTLPNRLDSFAVVDEAWIAKSSGSLVHMQDNIETQTPTSFSSFDSHRSIALNIDTEVRDFTGECQYKPSNYPAIHYFGEIVEVSIK
jgi:Zn-dependent peptidase ImmA (M78 family)